MSVNGVYIVLGEANTVVALLNKARRQYQLSHQPPSLEDTDPLLRNFADLKEVLNEVADLADMNPLTYLSPFLDVIKAQNTNGPITEASLSGVAKFLSYGLIDASSLKAANAVESIAYAVVHTKFIGGKSSGSDECVLFKILQVVRSLLLSPPGSLLSNEAVCDMMQSCFRIVFEQHLSPLLRKAAEATLSDMTQLIFTRLPTFREDIRHPYIRKLVMNAKGEKKQRHWKKQDNKGADDSDAEEERNLSHGTAKETDSLLQTDPSSSLTKLEANPPPVTSISEEEKDNHSASSDFDIVTSEGTTTEKKVTVTDEKGEEADSESDEIAEHFQQAEAPLSRHVGLQREVRLDDEDDLPSSSSPSSAPMTVPMPYGLPCCRELLRFLIALTNPLDRANTESMVVLGLNLLTVALEASADYLSSFNVLMPLIKNNLCRALLQLLDTEKLPVLAATNRACFLLFESMRSQLKFQLEEYFHKLRTIITSEQRSTSYEQKEMALESMVQLWRIPGLVSELYLNYDCDLYCSNLFEDLTKLLVENAFPVSGLHTASLLSLDALLVVIDTIDENCICRQAGSAIPSANNDATRSCALDLPILSGFEIGKKIIAAENDEEEDSLVEVNKSAILVRSNRHAPSDNLPSMGTVIDQKKRKRMFAEGTELFNQNPKKGIEFLREKGLLGGNAEDLVAWLRINPQLVKKKIADYICNRKNADVLQAFVRSFPFENSRLDESLRMFLETFRLPGEAAEISMVMQCFSEEWYRANGEPFNHVDAAFTLSYAIIMLNVDQHNPTAKRSQPPMTVDCFKRNLSGTNGGKDFDPSMLDSMFNAIKQEEIVMPAEHTGLIKENYMWKVLLRRGETIEGVFVHAPTGWNDHDLFCISWGPAVAALSYVFDKTDNDVILQKTLNGYGKCASIAAHYGMKDVFDNLVIHLCKFSTLVSSGTDGRTEESAERQRNPNEAIPPNSPEGISLAFGENKKAQLAARTLFQLVHTNGDILREGWRNMLDVMLQLFRARLLPSQLTEVDDFVDEKGWVSIVRQHNNKDVASTRTDSGLLSWFGLGGGTTDSERRKPTAEQQNAIKLASTVISECRPSQLIADSKYLTSSSLTELVNALIQASSAIVQQVDNQKQGATISGEKEDSMIFFLELIISISLENKDRLSMIWSSVRHHIERLLSPRFGRSHLLAERAVVGLLRLANRNLFRDNTVADHVLHSLSILLNLSPKAMFVFSRQIAFGLDELLRTNAANVHKKEHWSVLYSLMEAAGAAVLSDDHSHQSAADHGRNAHSDVEKTSGKAHTDIDKGYTSDDVTERRKKAPYGGSSMDTVSSSLSGADSAVSLDDQSRDTWIHLDHKDAARATEDALRALGGKEKGGNFSRGSLVLCTQLGRHEPAAFLKICECLAFLLRDAAHVTPENYESSVACLRTMVEASLDGGRYAAGPLSGDAQNNLHSRMDDRSPKRNKHMTKSGKKELSTDVAGDEDDVRLEEQQLSASYQQVSLQLIDLSSTLHNLTPNILMRWASSQEENGTKIDASIPLIWKTVWLPLLQAIARLGCDCRRIVRAGALTHLQRALLPSNMVNLGAAEWESCFSEVLFPLLTKLLEPFSAMDPIGMEDTRVRGIQIVAKTLLNHLTALSSLATFPSLWLRLLDFMEKYLRVDSCGNLNEAVPESLKNMLLVLENTGLFSTIPGLYQMTVTRMQNVLPQLIREILANPPTIVPQQIQPNDVTSLVSASSSSRLPRVLLAPAIPSQDSGVIPATQHDVPSLNDYSTASCSSSSLNQIQTESTQYTAGYVHSPPVPELTEVIVHSGAASPIIGSPQSESSFIPSEQHRPQEVQQQVQTGAGVWHSHAPHHSSSSHPPPPPAHQYYSDRSMHQYTSSTYDQQQQQQQQHQQYHQHHQGDVQQPIPSSYQHNKIPLIPQNYQAFAATNQMYSSSQQYMPQADLAKAFATPVSPNYMGNDMSQYSVSNPLAPPHNQPLIPSTILATSPNSAFTQVHDPNRMVPTHPSTCYFTPIQHPPQEGP